jgi:nuclear transport factor 2 (NTF2) superfamily protein
VKPEGANKLHYQRKLNGKVMNEGTYTLSADKKTMTEESWNAGRETDKVTIVYDKQ